MHIFDISDKTDPELVGSVELSARPEADSPGCGTHTLTLVPDAANNRAVIYNATSGGNTALPVGQQDCDWIDIVQVPLDNPAGMSWVRREPLEGGHAAHDNGVILGDVNKLATASGHMSNVFSIGGPNGGSLTDPEFLYTIEEPGVCNTGGPLCNGNWHSAAFTWDGEVVILGWEPGGGAAPECEASDPAVKKSAFFYDADTGEKLGQWTLPRAQTAAENCTIHNYNIVPTRNGRYIMVGGHYQAGTWVVDFTDPANAEAIAWSDPPPAGADPARWRVVLVLVQRVHIRIGDPGRVERLPPGRQGDGRSPEAGSPEPADVGVLVQREGHRQGAREGEGTLVARAVRTVQVCQ